jgi:hypothetical protein
LDNVERENNWDDQKQDMRITYLIGTSIFMAAVAACSTLSSTQHSAAIQLGDGSLTVLPPRGLVPVHWDDSPSRVIAEFNLPEEANGGQPAYPDIYVDKLGVKDSGTSLDDYMHDVVSRRLYGEVGTPKEVQIDGIRGITFVAETHGIADFTDGRAATYVATHYETAFWHASSIYRCVMETAPDVDSKYVSVYEDFCSTMRFRH